MTGNHGLERASQRYAVRLRERKRKRRIAAVLSVLLEAALQTPDNFNPGVGPPIEVDQVFVLEILRADRKRVIRTVPAGVDESLARSKYEAMLEDLDSLPVIQFQHKYGLT